MIQGQGARAVLWLLLVQYFALHCDSLWTEASLPSLDQLQTKPVNGHNVLASGDNVGIVHTYAKTTEAVSIQVMILFLVLLLLCAISLSLYTKVSVKAPDTTSSQLQTPQEDASNDASSSPQQELGQTTCRATAVAAEFRKRHWVIDDGSETMTRFKFVVNMFGDLCPPGMLALPSGLATTGFIPGFIMLLVFYVLCVFTMYAIGMTSQITGAQDIAGQWKCTIGHRTAWIPVAIVMIVCMANCLAYSCFFADIFFRLMPSFGMAMPRSMCLIAFTLFPLFPLCLLKKLSALSKTSTFALVAVLYTASVMVWRAVDGSYAEGGKYFNDMSARLAPAVPSSHMFDFSMGSLKLLNYFAVAFLAHYNGCKYYRELENHTPMRLLTCTATSMGISVLIYMVTMTAGFLTFGTNCDAVILVNYSRKDTLVNIARLGIGLSIIASFPLMFSGLREAAIALLKQISHNAADWDVVLRQDVLSMCLLALITFLALVMSDTGVVVGLVGAICGSTIIYIVPCSLYAASIQAFVTNRNLALIVWLRCLTVLGAMLAAGGCYSTLFL